MGGTMRKVLTVLAALAVCSQVCGGQLPDGQSWLSAGPTAPLAPPFNPGQFAQDQGQIGSVRSSTPGAAFAFALGPDLPSSTPITQPGHTAWDPIVASDGRDYLVEWHDARSGERIAKLSSDGTLTPPDGMPIQRYGSLAWNGTNYVVFWVNDNTVEIT